MTEINSPQNAHFKLWKTLLESRGIKKEGLALLSGRKIVPEILQSQSLTIKGILSDKKADQKLNPTKPFFLLHKPLFEQLDTLGTHGPLLLVETPKLNEWKPSAENTDSSEIELLLGLSDPSNLGAVFRSAQAFGVKNVVLLKESAHPFLPKVLKTSAGAGLQLSLFKGPSIQELDISNGICLDLEGEPLAQFKWPKGGRLLLGEEGQGIPKNLKFQRIKIPISKNTESLNAVVALSIALYDRQTKLSSTSR